MSFQPSIYRFAVQALY